MKLMQAIAVQQSREGDGKVVGNINDSNITAEVNISSYPARILAGLFFFVVQKY